MSEGNRTPEEEQEAPAFVKEFDLLSLEGIAEDTGMPVSFIRSLARKKKITVHQIGRSRLVHRAEARAEIRRHLNPTSAPPETTASPAMDGLEDLFE